MELLLRGSRDAGIDRCFAPGSSGTAWCRPIPFGLAVGACHVGPCSNVPSLRRLQALAKAFEMAADRDPLLLITCRHTTAWSLNQANARLQKAIVLPCSLLLI